jgi:ferredoxin-type protein NapH
MRRQQKRKLTLFLSLLLLPVTLFYISPYVIIEGALLGIASGSMVAFAILFLSSLAVGRAWCGWLCPTGGLQEVAAAATDKRPKIGKWNNLKYAIWVPWLGIIAAAAIIGGGIRTIDPFFLTWNGISVSQPVYFIPYFIVVGGLVLLSMVAGQRSGCHYICFMAPFMIVGRRIRNQVGWPALQLGLKPDADCSQCGRCSKACPMSINVMANVRDGDLEHTECILCGSCADTCPTDVITVGFGRL